MDDKRRLQECSRKTGRGPQMGYGGKVNGTGVIDRFQDAVKRSGSLWKWFGQNGRARSRSCPDIQNKRKRRCSAKYRKWYQVYIGVQTGAPPRAFGRPGFLGNVIRKSITTFSPLPLEMLRPVSLRRVIYIDIRSGKIWTDASPKHLNYFSQCGQIE